MGDISVHLDESQNLRSQIFDLLTELGLIKLMHHFRKCIRCHHLKMWNQVCQGTMLRARCDYILGTKQCIFEIVGIRDISNYSLFHFALQACLLQHPMSCHT